MHRAFPWILAVVFFVAFAASFLELQRMRTRFGEATTPVHYHVHADVRRAIIAQQLARVDAPIVVLGDSLIEAAIFPKEICGRSIVNAGIGGSTLKDFRVAGLQFLDGSHPSLIVIALGINDALAQSKTFESDLRQLIEQARRISPKVAAFGISTAEAGPLVDDSNALNHAITEENQIYAQVLGGAFSAAPSLGSSHTVDGIHIAPRAYNEWAGSLFSAIETAVCPSPAIR